MTVQLALLKANSDGTRAKPAPQPQPDGAEPTGRPGAKLTSHERVLLACHLERAADYYERHRQPELASEAIAIARILRTNAVPRAQGQPVPDRDGDGA